METTFDQIWVVVSGYTGSSKRMLEMHLAEFGCHVSEDLSALRPFFWKRLPLTTSDNDKTPGSSAIP